MSHHMVPMLNTLGAFAKLLMGILWGPSIPHGSVHIGRIMKGTFITREDRTNLAQSLFLDTVKTGT